MSLDGVIREALDELELVLDLAALVGDLLLSAVPCQFHCVVYVGLSCVCTYDSS